MRDKRDLIVAEFAKVNGTDVTVDAAFEALDTFTHYEETFDHETACYDEVWESPLITAHNKKAGIMGQVFFTLYELKPDYEPNTYRPAFKFVLGRLGNTRVWNID